MWFQFVLVLMLASSSMNTANAGAFICLWSGFMTAAKPRFYPQQDFLAKLLPGLANGMAGGGTNGGSLPALSS
uniref:Uncharacterized protein n=1 Tax=Ditylenchus dipsaci TaxID=166011 RepID=A0A915CSP6_9BILA